MRSSIIKRIGSAITNVAQTADSKNQIGANIGTAAATAPTAITIINMGFEAAAETDCFLVDQATDMYFDNCLFKGNKVTIPTTVGSSKACVRIESLGSKYSTNIKFNNCVFENHSYGVKIDDEVRSVTFAGCRFNSLFKGAIIGLDDSTTSPKGVKIINSAFDNIYDRGIHVLDGTFTSAFNWFNDVGNAGAGSGSPTTPVIEFTASTSYSMGDIFERPNADDDTFSRIESNNASTWAVDQERVRYGRYDRTPGTTITLTDTASAIVTTGLSFLDTTEKYVEIEYSIVRDSAVRNGLLRITHDSSTQTVSEEYDENDGDVGFNFSVSNAAGITTLNYLTDVGGSATFTYTTRILV